MKHYTSIAFAFLLAACGNTHKTSDLDALMLEKDSLKSIYDELTAKIAGIDEQIAIMDTTEVRIPLVTILEPEIKTFMHYFEVQGAVETDQNALLYSETAGEVIRIPVSEGQKVSKGDVLIEVDSKVLSSSIKEVETAYATAKDVFMRQEKLWNQKIGSEMQYIEAKANKESMEQKLKTLNAQLDMYHIKAPFAGIVDEIMPKVGESAMPGMPVVRIVNLDQVYIKTDVSENYLGVVKEGTFAKVNFPSINKEVVTKVNRTGNFINPNNRTFKIKVDLLNPNNDLIPNLLANIRIMDFSRDSAIVVPSRIIQQDRNNKDYVYVTDKTNEVIKVKKLEVQKGISYKDETMIVSGLTGTEKLIDQGARSVQSGDIVLIMSK